MQYRYQPLFSYAFKGYLSATSDATRVRDFLEALLDSDDEFLLQRNSAALSGYSLNFDKKKRTHLVYKEVRYHDVLPSIIRVAPDAVGIGLVRDPRAVVQSWICAPREFMREWNIENEWRFALGKNAGHPENWYGFERWLELTQLLLTLQDQYPQRFTIVRYEDLVSAPRASLHSLFKFCGLPVTPQVNDFVNKSCSVDDGNPYGVFRRARAAAPDFSRVPDHIVQVIERETHAAGLGRFLWQSSCD